MAAATSGSPQLARRQAQLTVLAVAVDPWKHKTDEPSISFKSQRRHCDIRADGRVDDLLSTASLTPGVFAIVISRCSHQAVCRRWVVDQVDLRVSGETALPRRRVQQSFSCGTLRMLRRHDHPGNPVSGTRTPTLRIGPNPSAGTECRDSGPYSDSSGERGGNGRAFVSTQAQIAIDRNCCYELHQLNVVSTPGIDQRVNLRVWVSRRKVALGT